MIEVAWSGVVSRVVAGYLLPLLPFSCSVTESQKGVAGYWLLVTQLPVSLVTCVTAVTGNE